MPLFQCSGCKGNATATQMAELAWGRGLFDPDAVQELLQKEKKTNKASRSSSAGDHRTS